MDVQESKKISVPSEEQSTVKNMELENESEGSSSNMQTENYNRRCFLRPRKRPQSDMVTAFEESIQSPHKKRKLPSHASLETIFEEPVSHNDGNIFYLGLKKVKRYISFSQFVTKAKKKKRKSKVKRLRMNKLSEKKMKRSLSLKEVEGKLTQLGI